MVGGIKLASLDRSARQKGKSDLGISRRRPTDPPSRFDAGSFSRSTSPGCLYQRKRGLAVVLCNPRESARVQLSMSAYAEGTPTFLAVAMGRTGARATAAPSEPAAARSSDLPLCLPAH